jgi:nitroreductase
MSQSTEVVLVEKGIPDLLLARRSVRAYTQEQVDEKTINTLLRAAVDAPTAMHEEPWAFVLVQNRKILKHLSDVAKPLFIERLHRSGQSAAAISDPDFDLFHGAGTLIVICAKPSGPFVEADCWLAAENLMLAASGLGLGSCVIGSAVAALNTPEIKAELDIPVAYHAVAPMVVGVPKGITPPSPRKAPIILSWRK